MNVLPIVYKGLVKRGRCTINDVPEEYREETKLLLEGQEISNEVIEKEVETLMEENTKFGAVTIPNISGYPISVSKMLIDGKCKVTIPYGELFTKELFPTAYPLNVQYDITRIENNYMRFEDGLKVSVDTVDSDCVLTFEGVPKCEYNSKVVMLRIDVKIKSSNYEDMHFTIYLYAD